jgi:hypothetical protein
VDVCASEHASSDCNETVSAEYVPEDGKPIGYERYAVRIRKPSSGAVEYSANSSAAQLDLAFGNKPIATRKVGVYL